jgi:hypothetical protein
VCFPVFYRGQLLFLWRHTVWLTFNKNPVLLGSDDFPWLVTLYTFVTRVAAGIKHVQCDCTWVSTLGNLNFQFSLDFTTYASFLCWFYFYCICLFWDRVLLYSPGWPWTHSHSASVSWVLGLQLFTTMPGCLFYFVLLCYVNILYVIKLIINNVCHYINNSINPCGPCGGCIWE